MKNDSFTWFLVVLFVLIGVCNGTAQEEEKIYRIGNSLTWDSQPKSIEVIAEQRDMKQIQAYHINCGKTLERIWTHPEEVCVDPVKPYGKFQKALSSYEWDGITIQPYRPSRNKPKASTLFTDTRRFLDFINLNRSSDKKDNTTYYLYWGWPDQSFDSYQNAWEAELSDSKPITTRHSRAYFERLGEKIRTYTEAEVKVIPVGEVLYELGQMAREGKISGYSEGYDFYRDKVHLTSVGRFAAALTTFAVTTGEKPNGLTKPEGHYENFSDPDAFTEEVREAIYRAINTVLENR